ncbi:MoaD/ThiS family protein [Mycolicibacterium elephantis]|uniref:Molybdopterin synthase sulfur carrier subunit n=1 Tax=Mycolicibacterium elephantis TaxID=81858 RepID=A0A0M2ZQN6_9MYCO|nr:MoaD/ThiS family protein [Mycolicibacterium elephantis]KKW66545.1 molybdenum cofactor biosynthesis protein MoaD [Mycolicibacterium elephantis]OBA77144.1 molybdopterin synthase sulfur carrier subunit [Mycolicibacterium elephantis]OBB19874.1 molybdopterin synthase sulfur carrier subunit [Mycolicibacterium elephantis]OBE97369.1 molybdopterin synthase sulfur carrier subunit [Mycolicibacterium elephantis]ORA67459.1 molybdopterin synthase sulfur carrier subunit [Mycolicibacterium elephantis]
MTVNVSIPTILRTHTGGEKRVTASGDTLAAVIDDLEANYSGIRERLMDNGKLNRFVNIYVNDEDVRFSGGLDTTISDGDSVTILPAVAGG